MVLAGNQSEKRRPLQRIYFNYQVYFLVHYVPILNALRHDRRWGQYKVQVHALLTCD